MPALYRARFDGAMPVVRVRNGQVTVHYRGFFAWRGRRATMTLNADVPWDLELEGGGSRLTGELSALPIRSLVVTGGASRLDLTLGAPHGEVPVRLVGGASDLRLKRPAGSAVRLHLVGGMSKVETGRATSPSRSAASRTWTPMAPPRRRIATPSRSSAASAR